MVQNPKTKIVPLGEAIDGYGKGLQGLVKDLWVMRLKPATIEESIKLLHTIHQFQQLFVSFYNAINETMDKHIARIDKLEEKVAVLEKKLEFKN